MRKKISVLLLIFAFSTAIISCFNKNDNASSENKNEVKKENLEEQNLSTGGAASGDIFNLGKTQSKDESQNDKIDNLTMDEQKVLIENEIDPIKVSEAIKKAESGEKEAIMSLSQLYYNLKDNEKVKRFLKLGVDKNYPEAIYNLAVVYKNEGNTVEANKLIAKLPKNTNVNLPAGADEYNKAITFMKSKKYVEAKKQFEIAYKKGIKDVDIRIALLNKELKNTSEALKWFKIANKRGVKGTNYEIGAILYDSGKLKDSRPYLVKAYNEGEKTLAMPIAATYQNENNTTEALKWFKIAAKNGNKDAKNIIAQIEKPEVSNKSNVNMFFNNNDTTNNSSYTNNTLAQTKRKNESVDTTKKSDNSNIVKTESNIPTFNSEVKSNAKEKNNYNVDIGEIRNNREIELKK